MLFNQRYRTNYLQDRIYLQKQKIRVLYWKIWRHVAIWYNYKRYDSSVIFFFVI